MVPRRWDYSYSRLRTVGRLHGPKAWSFYFIVSHCLVNALFPNSASWHIATNFAHLLLDIPTTPTAAARTLRKVTEPLLLFWKGRLSPLLPPLPPLLHKLLLDPHLSTIAVAPPCPLMILGGVAGSEQSLESIKDCKS